MNCSGWPTRAIYCPTHEGDANPSRSSRVLLLRRRHSCILSSFRPTFSAPEQPDLPDAGSIRSRRLMLTVVSGLAEFERELIIAGTGVFSLDAITVRLRPDYARGTSRGNSMPIMGIGSGAVEFAFSVTHGSPRDIIQNVGATAHAATSKRSGRADQQCNEACEHSGSNRLACSLELLLTRCAALARRALLGLTGEIVQPAMDAAVGPSSWPAMLAVVPAANVPAPTTIKVATAHAARPCAAPVCGAVIAPATHPPIKAEMIPEIAQYAKAPQLTPTDGAWTELPGPIPPLRSVSGQNL